MGLPKQLIPYPAFGLDTSIFIYHFEAHSTYLPITQEIFSNISKGEKSAFTSTITIMEINVRPLQLGRQDIARKYEAVLVNYPHLYLVDINRNVARQAAQLRALFRLRPADALQIAACLCANVPVFITNDQRLTRVKDRIKIVLLDELMNS
jgi:predicted nucleic acid-binding protein